MATMIPYTPGENTASGAERKLFNLIKNDARTRDWVVFHSLHLEHHVSQLEGEADFVILAPNLGCFVIEVKGGGVSFSDGEWFTVNSDGIKSHINDPFEQANLAAHSIMDFLKGRSADLDKFVYFGTGVAFPDVFFDFDKRDVTFSPSQVYDLKRKNDFFTYIRKLSEYYLQKNLSAGRSLKKFKLPSVNEIEKIRTLLRPNFECIPPLSVRMESNSERCIRLTEQQMSVLDKLEYARSAIIHGAAGTGKTLLAVEMAKRKASVPGKKVALMTYTLYLTDFLKRQVAGFENISVFSISDYFEKKSIEYGLASAEEIGLDKKNFYQYLLPVHALKILATEPTEFDTIVIDEGQDFSAQYLILVSMMLKGHIAQGNYYIFGDFLYQGIYDHSVYQQQFSSYIEAMSGTPADIELNVNVRNSLTVQKELDRIAGITTSSIHKDGAADEQIYFLYEDEKDELRQIEKTLNKLIINEKISPERITILSRHHLGKSIASKITNFEVKQYQEGEPASGITFSSIRKFKGLENDIIIVADNDDYAEGNTDLHLLYVAMSRAACKVWVFESLEAQIARQELIASK